MKAKILIITSISLAVGSASAQGFFSNTKPVFGIAMGTYGPQASVGADVNKYLTAKVQGGYFKLNLNAKIDSATGTVSPEYGNFGAMVQFHPFGATDYARGFHTDFGLFYSNFHVTANPDDASELTPLKKLGIPAGILQKGDIIGTAKFDAFQPYIGIGYMWRPKASGFGVSLDLGAFYQGTANYSFDTSKLNAKLQRIVSQQAINQAITDAETSIRDYANNNVSPWVRWYPVLQLSVRYSV